LSTTSLHRSRSDHVDDATLLDERPPEHHDAFVRTTLTLDPDVTRMLEEEAHRQRKPFKQVVNEAIRRGLAPRPAGKRPDAYRVRPHKTSLRPGIDPGALNRLAEELEDEAVADKMRTGR
jgi:hypothetical protein